MKNRLKDRREGLGLTQPEIVERLWADEHAIDVGLYSKFENGRCLPNVETMEGLERVLGKSRMELYDAEDLDLLGVLPKTVTAASDHRDAPTERKAEPPSHQGKHRKCYRISKAFEASLPEDLLDVCGYSSWQSWHDAALKRLLGEYAARKKAMGKGVKTA